MFFFFYKTLVMFYKTLYILSSVAGGSEHYLLGSSAMKNVRMLLKRWLTPLLKKTRSGLKSTFSGQQRKRLLTGQSQRVTVMESMMLA